MSAWCVHSNSMNEFQLKTNRCSFFLSNYWKRHLLISSITSNGWVSLVLHCAAASSKLKKIAHYLGFWLDPKFLLNTNKYNIKLNIPINLLISYLIWTVLFLFYEERRVPSFVRAIWCYASFLNFIKGINWSNSTLGLRTFVRTLW